MTCEEAAFRAAITKMSHAVTNSSATLKSTTRLGKIDVCNVAAFSVLVLVGSVATLYPILWLGCLTVAAASGICWLVFVWVWRASLEFWQVLALTALSGYLVLNYGFDNLAVHVGGFPILISYSMMYAALALAVVGHWHLVVRVLNEPALG